MTFDDILSRVRRPSRYTGSEVNAVRKDPRQVGCHLALVFPDLYELAMSYLGLGVLYDAVNKEQDLWAERVFAPDIDMQAELSSAGLPLASLESRTPMNEFDLVGFTLQHELTYPDVLAMLKMGNLALRSDQRLELDPLVIAGGPGASNPEPLAPGLDAVFLGDAEVGLVQIARIVGQERKKNRTRRQIIDAIASIPGVYIPSNYEVSYDDQGLVSRIKPLNGAKEKIRRSLVKDLESLKPPSQPLVPNRLPIHDRLAVEIQRGCTRGCRFCQAGMINRPVRQRSARTILETIDQGLSKSGQDQVSLLSLSAGDHPHILDILEVFFQRHANQRIAASLPSLRAETLTPALAELIKTVRKSGFTIAPEAGSQRLRNVINKNLTEEEIFSATLGAFKAGWSLVKLYFMIGLPTETDQDREGIVELVSRITRNLKTAHPRGRIHVGISTFVPKAHTPFQWEKMIDPEQAAAIHKDLRRKLSRLPGVKVSWTKPEMSWAEGLLSRGDRRQFEALSRLVEAGQRLSGWSEHFDEDRIKDAFAKLVTPPGPDGFLRARSEQELLPWSHLDMGPSREFLLDEQKKAVSADQTTDCSRDDCYDCGACLDEDAVPILDQNAPPPAESVGPDLNEQQALTGQRLRLVITKEGPAVFLSHLEYMGQLIKALRRAAWPMIFSQGFHPKPKVAFGPACQVGVASRAEFVDVTLPDTIRSEDCAEMLVRLSANLPDGVRLQNGTLLAPGHPGIAKQVDLIRYRFKFANDVDPERIRSGMRDLLQRSSWQVTRTVKGKQKTVELRPSLKSLEIDDSCDQLEVACELTLAQTSCARPHEVIQAAFGNLPADISRETVLLQDPQTEPESVQEAAR